MTASFASSRSLRRALLHPRLAQHALQRHRHAPLAFALVGGFHESEDLDCFLGTHGRLSGLEELANLDNERLVAAVAAAGGDALGAEDGCTVARRAGADAAESADQAAFPGAGHQLRVLGL